CLRPLSLLSHSPLPSPLFLLSAPPTTETYTLSLHDALPISRRRRRRSSGTIPSLPSPSSRSCRSATSIRMAKSRRRRPGSPESRSEEHTSELQSRENLVCRLLLEKKKKRKYIASQSRNLGRA